jgi:7-cyano-7-deazaguanine reductase
MKETLLGKTTSYTACYTPSLLCPIPRQQQRTQIGVGTPLPFYGVDIWNAYEISWLNPQGKPCVALAEFVIPCGSPNLIESKSFKLYLNSFNNTEFADASVVEQTLRQDLSQAAGDEVQVQLVAMDTQLTPAGLSARLPGIYLDALEVSCDTYTVTPAYLQITPDSMVNEVLVSDLLKSNCLVTGQPDWGSVQIAYQGPQIDHAGLLKYIVSFRDHNEFHEQCVERIFMDILHYCQPQRLSVYARYTRRGGLDINPYRSTHANTLPENNRLVRQ